MTTIHAITHAIRRRGMTTCSDNPADRINPRVTPQFPRLSVVLPGLVLVLTSAAACSSADGHESSAARSNAASSTPGLELSPQAIDACRNVFTRTDAPGTQVVVIWDTTASVADMPFPAELAADLQSASLDDGTLTLIAVDGAGVAPRILAKDVALSTTGDRDRPSVAKLAEVMPSCVQAVYLDGVVPTAPRTDLHRAMTVAAEIADAGATLWTVSDMLSTTGQLVLDKDALAQPAEQAARTAAANAPVDLQGAVWKLSGLGNTASPLLAANREWLREFSQGLCRGWHATGCKAVTLDPVNPVRTAKGLPKDTIPPFPAVTSASTATACNFTLPDELTFAGGSAQLRDDVDEILVEPIELLSLSPQATLTVVGHTASSSAYTHDELIALSRARAQAVSDRILAAGLDASRVSTHGVGDSEPLAEDIDAATGMQVPDVAAAERRVELKVEGAPCSR